MEDVNSLKNIDKDLLKELECPICMEHMKPPIVMCENGHSLCNICKNKLKQCPTCKKPFTKVRNLALESLSSMIIPSSEESGPSTINYKCPFSKISQEDCTWNGRLKNMKKHIRTSHNNQNDAHVSDGNFNVVLTGFSQTRHYRKAQLIHQEVFYVFWEIKDGKFYCAVLNVGAEGNASNFKYKFSLTSKNGLKNISMNFPTRSIIEDLDKILKPGNCVLLHYETVVEFLDPNKILSCDFEISPADVASSGVIPTFKNDCKQNKANDSKKLESSSKMERGEFLVSNDKQSEYYSEADFFRGRGGRYPRRGRARSMWNRGRRGFPEMHHSGLLGLFSDEGGNLSKTSKFGWSLTDLRDESHYQADEWKSAPSPKGNASAQEPDLRSQLDSMSNNQLRELIVKTIEEKIASRLSSSSSQEESSEAKKPVSAQRSNSRKSNLSSSLGLPQEDILKIITKSFDDKPTVDTKKTSSSSQKQNSSTIDLASSRGTSNQIPSNEKVSASNTVQANALSDKRPSNESNTKGSNLPPSVGNTSSHLYPVNLLQNVDKSFVEKKSSQTSQKKPNESTLKPSAPSSSSQKNDLLKTPLESFQFSNVSNETKISPAPSIENFNPRDYWICALCNHLASKKTGGGLYNNFKPEGTTWFCKLCENWRP